MRNYVEFKTLLVVFEYKVHGAYFPIAQLDTDHVLQTKP